MQITKVSLVLFMAVSALLITGCVPADKYEDLKLQNRTQQQRLSDLEGQLGTAKLQLEQLKQQLATAQARVDAGEQSLRNEIATLEQAVAEKTDLINKLQVQLLRGGVVLPVELNTMLQDFADKNEIVTYDPATGVVKFKSDLLFEKGSDVVAPQAAEAIKSLCAILNSDQAKSFDIIVAGHTDDIPIKKFDTRSKHPNNWYLSAHRAVSVLSVMLENNMEPKRISVRGFGEYRPVEANAAGGKGNPVNRRVEIYIIPAGI